MIHEDVVTEAQRAAARAQRRQARNAVRQRLFESIGTFTLAGLTHVQAIHAVERELDWVKTNPRMSAKLKQEMEAEITERTLANLRGMLPLFADLAGLDRAEVAEYLRRVLEHHEGLTGG